MVIIECMAYYAPEIKFNLFSLQSYFMTQTSEVDFITNKNGVFFNLNNNDCIKISSTLENLPMAYSTPQLPLITCTTDARNVKNHLPQNAKRLLQWHYLLVGALQFQAGAVACE